MKWAIRLTQGCPCCKFEVLLRYYNNNAEGFRLFPPPVYIFNTHLNKT